MMYLQFPHPVNKKKFYEKFIVLTQDRAAQSLGSTVYLKNGGSLNKMTIYT